MQNAVNFCIFFPQYASPEGEDSISDTSGEELINPVGSSMTSTAIKKRLDSLAGSTYRLNTDSARENVDQKRRKNLRRWINNVKCGVLWKQFLKYRIDQHGELSSTNHLKDMCH